jgi:hypothetical protein
MKWGRRAKLLSFLFILAVVLCVVSVEFYTSLDEYSQNMSSSVPENTVHAPPPQPADIQADPTENVVENTYSIVSLLSTTGKPIVPVLICLFAVAIVLVVSLQTEHAPLVDDDETGE